MKNTGKIEWNSEQYPVKLVCIGGNINTANQTDQILVPNTKVNETASISVDLVAPDEPVPDFLKTNLEPSAYLKIYP